MCTFPAEVQPGAALLSFQQFYRDYHGMETAGAAQCGTGRWLYGQLL